MRSFALVASTLLVAALVWSCSGSSDDANDDPPLDLPDRTAAPAEASSNEDGGSSGNPGDASADARDSGTARDLSPNRAAFFGASRCAAAGVKLCEDFESGTIDTATWTTVGTAPVIDGVQHARGQKALHISVNGDGPSFLRETKSFPATNNAYWGRMFVWFESLPAAPMTYAHWTFAAATGKNGGGEIRLSGQLSNGKNLFGVGTDNQTPTGTGDWTNSDNDPPNAPVAVPTKKWLCIEWAHKGDTNETRFYWDAVEHPSLHTSASMHGGNMNPYVMPTFNALWVGWNEYQTSTQKFEMWVDEIALDDQRIGCIL